MTKPFSCGWPSPAKLNLFLHIVGRDARGYHLLQSVFQLLDHGDSMDFAVREDGRVERVSALEDVPYEDDLCIKAALALKARTGCPLGVDIKLHKLLPMGGGIGGGSSNAATTLVALNALWQTDLSDDELAEIGLALGADVPVFTRGQSAWAEGVGEKLTPVSLPEKSYLVVHPGVFVSTPEIFSEKALTRDSKVIKVHDFFSGEAHLNNSCEAVVSSKYPDVEAMLTWLSDLENTDYTRLTGTGSCGFAVFANHEKAKNALEKLPSYWSGFIARGVNRSPLLKRLDELKHYEHV